MTFEQAMEPLYRYVDGLSDEARDNIVTALDWRPGAYAWEDGARCLIGHAADVQPEDVRYWDEDGGGSALVFQSPSAVRLIDVERHSGMYAFFDHACHTFGLERVVQVLKARAGHAPLTPSEPTPAEPQKAEALR